MGILSKYEISICIPNFNRLDCLGDLLDSIVVQDYGSSPVQICISDDASTEDIEQLVSKYQKIYPHILYYRFEKNVGLDRNLLKSVAMASGKYCWLMGNDDKIEQNSIHHILKLIKKYNDPTVINVNGWQYDRFLKERLYHRVRRGLKKRNLIKDQLFNNLKDIVCLFGDSFGFLGDNLFDRNLWNNVVEDTDLTPYIGSYYIHLAVLLMMLKRSPQFLYIHQQCVGFRGNNDGFLEILGEIRRLKLDVKGYSQVANGVFPNRGKIYRLWLSRIIKVHIRSRVLGIKMNSNNSSIKEAASITFNYLNMLPSFWIFIFPLLIIPRRFFVGLRPLYRATLKKVLST
jgi:abequosyltransferase